MGSFLLFLQLSTYISSIEIVGSFGAAFSIINKNLFGYLSYIYLLVFIFLLYKIKKTRYLKLRVLELAIAYTLIFISALLFQALLIDDLLNGDIGLFIIETLSPYIGLGGVWILWIISSLLAFLLISDKSIEDLIVSLKQINKKDNKQKPVHIDELIEDIGVDLDSIPKNINKIKNEPTEEEPHKEEQIEQIEEEPKEDEPKEEESIESINLPHVEIATELEENKKLLQDLDKGKVEKPKDFKLPDIKFLQKSPNKKTAINESEIDKKISYLLDKLKMFKIDGDVVRTYTGPLVTTFEFKPAPNVKVSKILNLSDDLAMALSAQTIRIQAPIPGKDVVGIEIPNAEFETIYLRDIIDSKLFQEASSPLSIVLGKDIVGNPFITDLKKLPHLLVAGTTGSGKSVGINAMILSLLYKNSPDNLRLIMIDPKMLEFSIYNDIPHLLTPVITKAKQAIAALTNMVKEMERRYAIMSHTRVKNIENYNIKAKKENLEYFPYIVIVIDELADLMMTSGKDVEHSIARLAQMARASGIHLVVATQRPSVDVVTGLIKANLPSRISYRVGQKIDSKVILDAMGAESLLGRGDMLFTPPGAPIIRLHAPWSSEDEIEKIVEFLKQQKEVEYDHSILSDDSSLTQSDSSATDEAGALDSLYEDAKNIVKNDGKTSISYIQRKLQIGYNRAARIVEQLEKMGVLSAPNSKGAREILL